MVSPDIPRLSSPTSYMYTVTDKFQSLYQGRPCCLPISGTNLTMKYLDDHDELELFDSLSYTELTNLPMSPAYSISCFTETCKLSIILDSILQHFYTEKSGSRNSDNLLDKAKSLHAELESWRKSLAPHLDFKVHETTPLPHTLSLLCV